MSDGMTAYEKKVFNRLALYLLGCWAAVSLLVYTVGWDMLEWLIK